MKAAKLIVRNFGPLKEVNISVTNFLCLIGKQATGKSTLAKLIAILENEKFTGDSFKEELMNYGLYDCLKEDTYISYSIDTTDERSLLYFTFTFENNKISFKNFKTNFEDFFKYELRNSSSELRGISESISNILSFIEGQIEKSNEYDINEIYKFINYYKIESIFDSLSNEYKIISDNLADLKNEIPSLSSSLRAKKINNLKNKFKILQKNTESELLSFYYRIISFLKLDALYIPSERNFLHIISNNILGLINNNIQIPKHLLEIGQEYEKALNQIKELPLKIIDNKFVYKREGKTSYIYHGKNEKTDLLKSASGLQSVLPILLLIEHTKALKEDYHYNYIIEEPELNIYPETQYALIKYLIKSIFTFNKHGYQRKKLIITTHSPYILASINNLLLAYEIGQEKYKETSKYISASEWINPNNFNCYELRNGKAYKIMNHKLGQIKSNSIDGLSDKFSDEFDKLLNL